MWYSAKVYRDENKQITGYWLNGKGHNQPYAKGEHAYIFDTVDHDIELCKVEVVEGELVIVPDEDKIAAKEAEDQIAMRMKRQEFGRRVIAIMSIRNDTKTLTTPQIVQFRSDYADINEALQNGSIGTARALINAITPDGTITTSADKTALLAEIDANLAALGYE
jgi:hypothetical protein